MRRLLHSEDGATAVLVAASILMLASFVALAVDGGLGYDERRDTQGAADMASLAAAFAGPDCENEVWELAGLEAAAQNGFDNNGVTNTVTITDLGPSGPYLAEVESIQSSSFAGVMGVQSITVRSQAKADCVRQSGLGGYAVFASAAACPPDELKINASGLTIDGGVHSNGDLNLSASVANPGQVIGDITWVGSEIITAVSAVGGTAYQLDVTVDGFPPTPGGWEIDSYRPGAAAVPPLTGGTNASSADYYSFLADTTLTGPLADGIYFVDGDLTLNSMTINLGTFVATGQINLTGSANVLNSPYDSTGLGLYSDHPGVPDCVGGDIAIQWSSANNVWAGVQYAPNGRVVMSSADGSSFNGSIIAFRVDLAGSDITIIYDDTYTGIEVTSLRLLE